MPEQSAVTASRSANAPSVLTGIGLGAFMDGIVFHQVLQWHHLVVEYQDDDTLPGLESNTFWDGVFHIACWVIVLVGVLWLRARGTEARALGPRRFAGLLLVGVGTFHVVDQIVFHVILQAHHIRMVENYQVYDWSYFAVGLLLIAVGRALWRR
jgi:uncharacterized membrane protein